MNSKKTETILLLPLLLLLPDLAWAAEAASEAAPAAGMAAWKVWLLSTVVGGFVAAWARKNLGKLIAGYVLKAAKKGIAAKGITDADLRTLIKGIVLLLVRHAEKKLPDKGLGPKKLKLIEDTLKAIPIIGKVFGWIIANYPADWTAIVEECVRLMDAGAKDILDETPAK